MPNDPHAPQRKKRSLVTRITSVYLFWSFLAYLVTMGGVWWSSHKMIEEGMRRQALQYIPEFDEMGTPLYVSDTSSALERIGRRASNYANIMYIRYYNADGTKLLGQYHKLDSPDAPPLPVQHMRSLERPELSDRLVLISHSLGIVDSVHVIAPVRTRRVHSDGLLDMALDDKPRESVRTIGYIDVGMNLDPGKKLVLRGIVFLGGMLGVLLILSFAMGRQFIRNALAPLLQLQQPLHRLAEGDFDVTVEGDPADREIATISDALRTTIAGLRSRELEKEEALHGKLDAEAASQAKSQFLAHMSHEIRTPLNGVLGFLGLLGKTQLDQVQRDYLRTTEISAKTLLTVINDILDFSKIEAGKLSIESIGMDLREVIEDCISLHAPTAQNKGVDVILLFHHDVPTKLLGDPGRITQVLSNLISNAIKFTESGDVVVIVSLVGESAGNVLLEVSVTDTGIGIPAESLSRLFQAFSQADDSTTRKYGGTGLGLIISKKLVEMMGGAIAVESTPGEGSRFHFTMSLQKQEEQPAHGEQPGVLGHLRVLTVTPNAKVAQSLREHLLAWRMEEHTCTSAAAAVGAIGEAARNGRPFDSVIMDTAAKDMAPADFAAAVQADAGSAPPHVIFLGNASDRLTLDHAGDAASTSCLTKPPKSSELYNRLSNAVVASSGLPLAPKAAVPEQARHGTAAKALRVLVVDDNEINRKLAGILLQQLGATIDQAENGVAAVEECSRNSYDIVLMDMHMPVMDGIEATSRIRKMQQNGPRTPIVALTANALSGDRERYLEAGMDDYLAKPLSEKALLNVMARWCGTAGPSASAAAGEVPRAAPAALPVIDARLGVTRAFGQADVWRTILDMLVRDMPVSMASIEAAFAGQNLEELRKAAHKLHGSSSYCGTPALQNAAKSLELACMNNEPEQIGQWLQTLREEAGKLQEMVASGNIPNAEG
jgi:signal transduction histidine kinase/CheY-like chemotaxis protein